MAKNDEPAEAKTVVTKLRCLDHRGETVHTRWGHVTFDGEGLAEIEVPENELQMLREIRPHSWLAEDHISYQMMLRGEGDPDVEVTTEPEKPAAVVSTAPPAAPQASSKGRR
jgi:hypothetical protein